MYKSRGLFFFMFPGPEGWGLAGWTGLQPGFEIDLARDIWYAADGMDKRLAALGLIGIGFFVAGSIILGVAGGHWLDTKLNTEPLWLIVGLFLGLAVAFYGVYTMLRPFLDNKRDKGNS